ncbi:MAG: DegT/DnrJ/EryC1/StrS family aminotransferase, partial [Pirellulales bacterium]
MWARKRLDIGWFDLGYATLCCCLPGRRAERQRCIESLWSGSGDTLACLSVRSGFDLLLEALALPPGSEVLVSALTIKDMVRIIDEHGLLAVPVDLEPGAMAPDLDSLRQAITPATRAILVAHLFGGRIDLEPIVRLAEEHGLLVIEDCAQAYVGPHFVGHPGVAASMFSFGPIKTATALGGGLIRVADPALVEA